MTQQETDITYMRRCLQLAAQGLGRVRPNPMVGCVVVAEGKVVAEGFHQCYGENHAERNALLRLPAVAACNGATLYVNLEPCSHYGKTPPCADLIVERGVGRVVCCNDDPNPLVAGRGFEKLRAADIEVVRHVLEEEGRRLNRRFFTYMERRRPYVILKWAESGDGYMAPDYSPYWISTLRQTLLSHKWRTEEAAILVGSQTFIDDRPRLTARLWHGADPRPVVLDRRGRLDAVPAHWLHLREESPALVLQRLYEEKVQSVIVEGGRRILDAFIEAGLYDEVRILRNDACLLGGGIKAPKAPAGALYF
ncbi:MAG: bifunctional diaminohydroxyphosphoribosylaminopyrimidine deaminase/5-amino-6-(5-phosphoribosylamino)uracil reductase RibD [Bacteroidales bacterium]|nr:bifunctional diaminohydroxyphosphoribosylaminopyrimidine deaminase/5-amino-6-(5-phosphoribosylamino)uracil reductase RibD [Bacteroidales bacterium]